MHTLDMVTHRVDILLGPVIPARVLGSDDHLVSVASRFHPFTDPTFRVTEVVQVGGVCVQ